MLSATGESKEKVEPWVEELGALYPVLCQAQTGSYSTGGVPTAYLIAADGSVAWHGHPSAIKSSDIEGYLKKVEKAHRVSTFAFTLHKQVPPLPEKMASLMKLMEKKKFGSALKKAESIVAKLEGDDKDAGEAARAWIAKRGESGLETGTGLEREGKIYEAYLAYGVVEAEFKGHALGKKAKDAIKLLKSGKETKVELKASEKLVEIKKAMAKERKAEDKLALLKPLLGRKYADTAAGKVAATMAEELEAQVEK